MLPQYATPISTVTTDPQRNHQSARVIRPGNTMTVVAADVFSISDGREKQTAAALATIAVIESTKLPAATG